MVPRTKHTSDMSGLQVPIDGTYAFHGPPPSGERERVTRNNSPAPAWERDDDEITDVAWTTDAAPMR